MKLIPLTQGLFAKVDDDDYEWLSQYNWFAKKTTARDCEGGRYYAARSTRINGYMETIYMHREVARCPKGKEVDHKKKDRLDNRKENLRALSRREHNKHTHNY